MARVAKKKSKEKELSLEDALWNCRVALRGVASMEKTRDAVISLVFLKFAGDKFKARRAEIVEEYGDIPAFLEKPSFYNAKNVFYLPEEARWDYLVAHAADNDIAIKIDAAMKLAEDNNPALVGALPLGLFATLTADIRSIKALIDAIGMISQDRFHEEDLIGRTYEYFLQAFAVGSSKEDGEFYTPPALFSSLPSSSNRSRALSMIPAAVLAACSCSLTSSSRSTTATVRLSPLWARSSTRIRGACAR